MRSCVLPFGRCCDSINFLATFFRVSDNSTIRAQGWMWKKAKRTDRWLDRYVALRASFLTIAHSEDRQGSMSKVYQVKERARERERDRERERERERGRDGDRGRERGERETVSVGQCVSCICKFHTTLAAGARARPWTEALPPPCCSCKLL